MFPCLNGENQEAETLTYIWQYIILTNIKVMLTPLISWHVTHGGGWTFSQIGIDSVLKILNERMNDWMNELFTKVFVEPPRLHWVLFFSVLSYKVGQYCIMCTIGAIFHRGLPRVKYGMSISNISHLKIIYWVRIRTSWGIHGKIYHFPLKSSQWNIDIKLYSITFQRGIYFTLHSLRSIWAKC